MKVILLEDVKKVGKKDDVVDVSQGYANNFLFKQNLAVEADKKNMKNLNNKKESQKKQYNIEVENAKTLKVELEKREFVFSLKSGKNGTTFGSISTKQINQALKHAGYNIDKKAIIGDPIAHLGYDKVKIQLHKEVICEITIKVEGK